MAKVYLAMLDIYSSDDPNTTVNIERTKIEHVFDNEDSARKWVDAAKEAWRDGKAEYFDEVQETIYEQWSKGICYEIGFINKWDKCRRHYEYYILEYEVES